MLQEDGVEHCWICMEAGTPEAPLLTPCKCQTRKVHKACLVKWQIHCVGKPEENQCRFCSQALEDWKEAVKPANASVPTSFLLCFDDKKIRVPLKPGEEGKRAFYETLREMTGSSSIDELEVTFGFRDPFTDKPIHIDGFEVYEAALHCAQISACKRMPC